MVVSWDYNGAKMSLSEPSSYIAARGIGHTGMSKTAEGMVYRIMHSA
jgi:hypothetical protein